MEIGSVYNSGASFAERNPFATPISSYNKAYMAYGVNKIGREQENGGNLSKLSAEKEQTGKKLGKFQDGFKQEECQTCKERRYVDGSDDSGVSFQTPTKIPKASAMAAVRGHEQEHVVRNRDKDEREGKEIVSQSVTIHTGVCPECGETFVSGGTTRTTTRSDNSEKFRVGEGGKNVPVGSSLDTVA
ncbi:MAG: hypothetical protein J5992_02855 [Oscillospiraceae bacterium]|nr:hypothetical protein [Oscillospiraceae bacterium]